MPANGKVPPPVPPCEGVRGLRLPPCRDRMLLNPARGQRWRATFEVVLASLLIACESNPPPDQVAEEPAGRGLRAGACSEVPVAEGRAEFAWVLQSTFDQPSPMQSISTTDIAVAADSSLFVVDSREALVTHLAVDGTVLGAWGREGDGPGEFRGASSIALGPDQLIHVGDNRGRVTRFSADGHVSSTVQVGGSPRISDLMVLPNRHIVVATDVHPREHRGAYVKIIDHEGRRVRDVLMPERDTIGQSRPLLGHAFNPVRISPGPGGDFVVWYPMDNYFEAFDASGNRYGRVEGCLPEAIRANYIQQARDRRESQALVVLTVGVSFLADGTFQVASFHQETNTSKTIRIRRYSLSQGELEARDFDISGAPSFLDRFDYLGVSEFLAYNTSRRELGILRFTLR